MNRQTVWNLAKYGLGIGLLAWVIQKNWAGILDALARPLQPAPLVLGIVIYLACALLTFIRWYVLVRAQGLPFTIFDAIRLGLIGVFWSTFMPGSVGGDLFKAVFLAREQSRRTVAVATVIIDRLIGLWGLFGLVVILGTTFWLSGNPVLDHRSLQFVVSLSAAVVATSLVCWLLMGVLPQWRAARIAESLARIPKVGNSLAELWRAVWMYRCQGRSVALAAGMSIVGHVGFVLTFYLSARVFLLPDQANLIPSIEENFILVPIGMTWQAIFPTPGGVGGGELGFGMLYVLAAKLKDLSPELVAKSEELGVLASLVARIITWIVALIGIGIYLWMKPALEKAAQQIQPDVAADLPEPSSSTAPQSS